MLGFARGDPFSAEFTGFASIFNCSWRHFNLQSASRLDLASRTPNLALGSASCIGPKKNLTEVRGQASARAVGEVTERRSTVNLI